MAIVLTVVIGDGFSNRSKLEEVTSLIERSLRSGVDEAALRNVITRVNFKLDGEVQEFAVEYGPDADFVIPTALVKVETVESLAEQEARIKAENDVDKKFNRVKELADDPFKVEGVIKILGVGTKVTGAFVAEGNPSVYIYPTGERDAAFIALASEQEIVVLTSEAFTDMIEINYYPLEDSSLAQRLEKATELFKEWLNEK